MSIWRISLLATIGGLILALFYVSMARALEIVPHQSSPAILLTGDIVAGDALKVNAYLATHDVTLIALNSKGGVLAEGMQLGYVFENYRTPVIVPPGAICLSACAWAFLGAVDQRIAGTLGFHIAEREANPTGDLTDAQAYQSVGGLTVYYVMRMGYHTDLANKILHHTSKYKYLVFRDGKQLMKLYVSMDENTPISKFVSRQQRDLTWLDAHLVDLAE